MQGHEVFVVDAVRTPVGRLGGALAGVRPDDLGAVVIKALLERNPSLDPARVAEVYFGAANQAGEDNRNVAFDGLDFFVQSEEGMEGANAFAEKRPPDFSPYR